MTYFKGGSLFRGIVTTQTAAGSTILVASSKQYQQFTGTTTQTVVLPNATTLVTATTQTSTPRRFDILNRSTGIVTVNANGGGLLATVPANSQRYFLLTDGSTAAGSWKIGGVTSSGGGGVLSSDKFNLLAGMAGIQASTDNIESRLLKYNPDEIGGNYWLTMAPTLTVRADVAGESLNGYGYSIGGLDSSNTTVISDNHRYNDDSNFWLAKAVTPIARMSSTAFIQNSVIYYVGGSSTGLISGASATNQQYTDSTDAWVSKSSMTVSRFSPGRMVMNKAFIAGGLSSANSGTPENYTYDATLDAWYIRSPLPSNYGSSASFTLNNTGYIAGGTSDGSTVLNTSQRYREDTNSWSLGPTLSVARYLIGGGNAFNGFGYVAAGANSSGNSTTTNEEYADATASFVTKASLANARHYVGFFALNGQGYSIAGRNNPAATNGNFVEGFRNFSLVNLFSLKSTTAVPTSVLVSTLASDLASNLPVWIRTDGNNWKNLTSGLDSVLKLNETVSAKFTEQGQHYISGGSNNPGGTSTTASTEFYNPIANTWTTRQPQTAAVTGNGGLHLGGLGYSFGGTAAYVTANALTTVYSYSDITNIWTLLSGALTTPIWKSGGGVVSGFGYSLDGRNTSGNPTTTNMKFDPAAGTWSNKTGNTAARDNITAAPNVSSFLMLAGGYNGAAMGSVELYLDLTDSWTTKTSLNTSVYDVAAASFGGFGYTIGGSSGSATAQTQQFSVATNAWTTKTTMNAQRGDAGVNTLPSGIYAASGYDSGANAIGTSEYYNDAANIWTNLTSVNAARWGSPGGFAPGPYRVWEVRVGIPAFFAGVGSGVWVTKANNPSGSGFATSGTSGSSIFLNCNLSSVSYVYDLVTDSYVRIQDYPQTPQGQQNPSISTTVGDIIYSCGGPTVAAAPTFSLSPYTKTFTQLANMPLQTNYGHFSALNSFMYYNSGNPGGTGPNFYTQKYQPSTNTWAGLGNIIPATSTYCCGGPYNGYIYISGGGGGSGAGTTHFQYNDVTVSWATKTSVPTGTGLAFSAVINGEYFLSMGLPVPQTATQAYRDTTNAWIARSNSPNGLESAYGGIVGGTGFYSGGYNGANVGSSAAYIPSIKNAVLGLALEVK